MSKETNRLERAKRDVSKVAAVTSDKRLLARMDTILEGLDFLLDKMADEPSREEYIEVLADIIEHESGEGETDRPRILERMMENLEQGIWEIPGDKEQENG